MLAQLTVTDVMPVPPVGLESPLPSLEVVKLAWLSIVPVPQVVRSVAPETWTLKVLPGPGEAARSMGLLFSVSSPAALYTLSLHDALPIYHTTPVLLGKESVMVKPWATP